MDINNYTARQWQTPGPAPQGMLTPAAAKLREDEPTVTMVFPQAVIVTRDDLSRVHFLAGAQEVPEHLAGHWYIRAAGAVAYDKPEPAAKPAEPATAEAEPVSDELKLPLPAPVKAKPRPKG